MNDKSDRGWHSERALDYRAQYSDGLDHLDDDTFLKIFDLMDPIMRDGQAPEPYWRWRLLWLRRALTLDFVIKK